ncbi:hypothetical protein [Streptomyces sp. NPDC001568]|uniref:hypothetical protein n=1 Tax=Streptomyces sp. NPDC001568 TaxID=3364588 RepID=UPI0036780DF4
MERQDRGRELPAEFTGVIAQIGSGWDDVDADTAYVWVRLKSGREVKALIRDVEHTR